MEKTKKRAKIWLCIGIALMLLCMIVVSIVQTSGGKVSIKKLKIETDAGYAMSAYLFVPENAAKDNPAPAIVASHGYLNNKEMQDANFVELARRGFVVLAIDQPAHGNSETPSADWGLYSTDGVYQGALALSRMPFVDAGKIGVTGHSMGGMSCNGAIAAENANGTHLIAAVLLNCADATYIDSTTGAFTNVYGDRDVGIVSAVYDEFFHQYKDSEGNTLEAPYFMEGVNAQSFLNFGADPAGLQAREADTVYHETIDGVDCVRVIYRPDIIHPWSHFSARSTADTIAFFTETLGAPNAMDASNQVWQVKEAFNLVGAAGFVIFIVCFSILMVFTPYFSSLRAAEPVQPARITESKGKWWFWGSLSVSALFSMLIYRAVLNFGTSQTVNQIESLGIGLWAALCGLFTILGMFLFYRFYGKKNGLDLAERGVKIPLRTFAKTLLLALIVVCVSYSWVFFADYFFTADFRFWTLAIKTFEADKIGNALFPYLWLFMIYYVAASVSANCFNYNTIGGKHGWVNNFIVSLFATLPALILPWIQYITYYSAKHMMWPADNMHILWLFPIVLVLFTTTFISRYIYKVTRNPYIAGIVSAIIVTLMTVSNTCTTAIAAF